MDSDLEYFNYLNNRSRLSFMLRKLMYKSLMKNVNGRLLDIGCGLGEILEMHSNSKGVDINKYCVEHCKQKGLDCSVGSALNTGCANEEFDTVITMHLLEHLEEPGKCLYEIRRVLKTGGRAIIVVPTRKGFNKDKTHKTFIDANMIKDMLRDRRFTVEKVSYYPLNIKSLKDIFTISEMRVIAKKN